MSKIVFFVKHQLFNAISVVLSIPILRLLVGGIVKKTPKLYSSIRHSYLIHLDNSYRDSNHSLHYQSGMFDCSSQDVDEAVDQLSPSAKKIYLMFKGGSVHENCD